MREVTIFQKGTIHWFLWLIVHIHDTKWFIIGVLNSANCCPTDLLRPFVAERSTIPFKGTRLGLQQVFLRHSHSRGLKSRIGCNMMQHVGPFLRYLGAKTKCISIHSDSSLVGRFGTLGVFQNTHISVNKKKQTDRSPSKYAFNILDQYEIEYEPFQVSIGMEHQRYVKHFFTTHWQPDCTPHLTWFWPVWNIKKQ